MLLPSAFELAPSVEYGTTNRRVLFATLLHDPVIPEISHEGLKDVPEAWPVALLETENVAAKFGEPSSEKVPTIGPLQVAHIGEGEIGSTHIWACQHVPGDDTQLVGGRLGESQRSRHDDDVGGGGRLGVRVMMHSQTAANGSSSAAHEHSVATIRTKNALACLGQLVLYLVIFLFAIVNHCTTKCNGGDLNELRQSTVNR